MKNINLRILFVVLIIITTEASKAQISGISASKISSYCVQTVPFRTLEFEPSFYVLNSKKIWNNEGELVYRFNGGDSLERITGLSFRCTYGLTNHIELGVSAPTDGSSISFGTKYMIFHNDSNKNGLAVLAGINIPSDKTSYDISGAHKNDLISLAAGICYSIKIDDCLLADLDIQSQIPTFYDKKLKTVELFYNMDLGYYINKQIQIIGGFSYYKDYDRIASSYLAEINTGISYETGKDYLIVVSAPFMLKGKNTNKYIGFNVAFTTAIH